MKNTKFSWNPGFLSTKRWFSRNKRMLPRRVRVVISKIGAGHSESGHLYLRDTFSRYNILSFFFESSNNSSVVEETARKKNSRRTEQLVSQKITILLLRVLHPFLPMILEASFAAQWIVMRSVFAWIGLSRNTFEPQTLASRAAITSCTIKLESAALFIWQRLSKQEAFRRHKRSRNIKNSYNESRTRSVSSATTIPAKRFATSHARHSYFFFISRNARTLCKSFHKYNVLPNDMLFSRRHGMLDVVVDKRRLQDISILKRNRILFAIFSSLRT